MSTSPIKIYVGMPSAQDIPILTARSLMQWQAHRKYPSMFSFKIDTYIDKARNELVWNAVNEGATHLMFIDSDMTFPADGIDTLVEREKDIIGGLYYGRIHPNPMAFRRDETGTVVKINPDEIKEDVFPVVFVGTGFMLINLRVFRKLTPPFFTFTYKQEDFGLPEQGLFAPTGEDVYFCLTAAKVGFEVWCDKTIDLGHVGYHTYRKHDWDVYSKDKELYEHR